MMELLLFIAPSKYYIIQIFMLEPHIAEIVAHKTIINLFHFDLHLEHKSCSLPLLERNMKECKTSTRTYTHIQKFVLADYAVFLSVKCLRNH